MRDKTYSWWTNHNHTERTMTHAFQNEVRCIVSWAHSTLTIMLGERVIDVFPFPEGYTINTHNATLLRIAEIAARDVEIYPSFRRESHLKTVRHYVL